MDVTFVKAAGPCEDDRVYMQMGGEVARAPVHVVHDLPHLVVESAFGLDDGLWAELAAGRHAAAAKAVTARDPKRQKAGRIVSGAAAGLRLSEWLTPGHRRAKLLTNAVTNLSGDGPNTAAGVRRRVARAGDPAAAALLDAIDDATITHAVAGVRAILERWRAVPPGEALRLTWPLPSPLAGSDA